MSEAQQITQGEWHAVAWSSHAATTVVADHDGQRVVVAECSGHGRHSSDSLADAQLMAAAPALLAALAAVLAEHEFGYGLRCFDQCQAAIAKASGSVS